MGPMITPLLPQVVIGGRGGLCSVDNPELLDREWTAYNVHYVQFPVPMRFLASPVFAWSIPCKIEREAA